MSWITAVVYSNTERRAEICRELQEMGDAVVFPFESLSLFERWVELERKSVHALVVDRIGSADLHRIGSHPLLDSVYVQAESYEEPLRESQLFQLEFLDHCFSGREWNIQLAAALKNQVSRRQSVCLVSDTSTIRNEIINEFVKQDFLTIYELSSYQEAVQWLKAQKEEGAPLIVNLKDPIQSFSLYALAREKYRDRPIYSITFPTSLLGLRDIIASEYYPFQTLSRFVIGEFELNFTRFLRERSFIDEAKYFIEQKKSNYAIQILEHAVQSFPESPRVSELLGDLYFQLAPNQILLEKCLKCYQTAMKVRSRRSELVEKICKVLRQLGREQETIPLLQEILVKNPFQVGLRMQLAERYLFSKDLAAAQREILRARAIHPQLPDLDMIQNLSEAIHTFHRF